MKKIILSLTTAIILAGCSSNPETLKATNDSFQKSEASIPHFSPLATGGVQLPKADDAYSLPNIEVKKRGDIDIRPPLIPLAIIQNSITKFDGEHSLIVYPKQEAKLYNLQQVKRLLKEEGISSTTNGSILTTDWTKTERIGDKSIEIKYQIEQVMTPDVSALTVSILHMRRDGIIFTPNISDKQYYTSERLNRIVLALTTAYNKQLQDLSSTSIQ